MNQKMETKTVELPKHIVDKVSRIVDQSEGLFEDVPDYITHSIIFHNRNMN